MKGKGVLMLSAMMASMLWAGAADLKSMVFETTDGVSTSLPVEGLSMSFDGTKLVTNQQNFSLEISRLMRFYFSTATQTGVDAIVAGEAAQPVEVYSVTGVRVGEYADAGAASQQLPAGVYIVKSGRQTSKIIVK